MKTLYLHIGTTKTGTCAIQEFCAKNQKVLNQKGYCFPKMPFSYPGFGRRRNALFLQRPVIRDGVRRPEEETRRFLEGMEVIRQNFETYDNVILSDEGIWAASSEGRAPDWAKLKAYCDEHRFAVKIIVYLRRQDAFIDSLWRQRVKGTRSRRSKVSHSREEYLENILQMSRFDYCAGLKKIADVLGRESMTVRRYDRKSFPGGMIQADFLEAVGLGLTDEYVIPRPTNNESLTENTCEIKRIINSLPDLTGGESNFLREHLLKISAVSGEEYKSSMFSAGEARRFTEQYRQGNREVAKVYMDEEDADLFDMDFDHLRKWEKDNPYLLNDLIRFVTETNVTLLRKMEEESTALSDELERLKDNLRHPFRTCVQKIFVHLCLL